MSSPLLRILVADFYGTYLRRGARCVILRTTGSTVQPTPTGPVTWGIPRMEEIGKNVARLRKEAGWATHLDAYDATGIKPSVWVNLESRPPGPQGPSLRTLVLVRGALSVGLGRRVSYDEIIGESDLADRRAELVEEGLRELDSRSRRGRRSKNGSPRKGER